MNYLHPIVAICSVIGLNACAPHVYTLVPEKASAGQLQYASDGTGTLQLKYSGKSYSGQFTAEHSRRIHGEHQRHPGRIARPVLVALDGDILICDVQWPNAGKPAGACEDKMGARFDVRFD
jgi:hypothetical protein